jgi:iron complex transport system ATP-binding protein
MIQKYGKSEAIQADCLHFSYGNSGKTCETSRIQVLVGLDAVVREGEFVGILGPNGSGKTTFLKAILGAIHLDSGVVRYFGESKPERKQIAKTISLVPQHSQGGISLSVREMVTLGRIPHLTDRWSGFSAIDHGMVDQVMTSLGLTQFRDRPCGSLSGGEFQKVLLARALVQESRILLLDEATANLDLHHMIEIMDLVSSKIRSGCAVVAVMHDLNLAAGYCDRVLLMKNGSVRYEGTPTEVYRPEVFQEIFGIEIYIDIDERGVPFVLPRRSRKVAGL